MTWLLDVSALVAHLVASHEHHEGVTAWRSGQDTCALSNYRTRFPSRRLRSWIFNDDARATLAEFIRDDQPVFIPCDRRALGGPAAESARKTTDIYLAELPASRGWRLATLDTDIAHPAADLIPDSPTKASA